MRARADTGAHRGTAHCRARATDGGTQAHDRAYRRADDCADCGSYRRAGG